MFASPSNRATAHVNLTIGVLMIPVDVFAATTKAGLERHRYRKTVDPDTGEIAWHEVKNAYQDAVTQELIAYQDITSLVSTPDGPVEVTDEEIESLVGVLANSLKFTSFHDMDEWTSNTYLPKKAYRLGVTPNKKGKTKVPNEDGEKLLFGLLDAMRRANVIAVGEFVSRGKPKPVVLLPDGTMHEVCWEEEVREAKPMPMFDLDEATRSTFDTFVTMFAHDKPASLSDVVSEKIQEYADEKAKGTEVVLAAVEAPAPPATDMLAVLQASIEAAKLAKAS